jgi:hypothetical protein
MPQHSGTGTHIGDWQDDPLPRRKQSLFPASSDKLHWQECTMKRSLLILGVMSLIMASTHSAYTMQSTILEQRNEYGGKTQEESYSSEDDKYKEGLAKLVQYFDSNDRIMKLESYFNDDHAQKNGIKRSIQYFDNKYYRAAIRTRVEFYYEDSYSAREGLAKAIQYYDEDEKRTRIDYSYTDTSAKKRQIYRLEVLYDPKGNITKRTYTDKDGKVLLIDEKK